MITWYIFILTFVLFAFMSQNPVGAWSVVYLYVTVLYWACCFFYAYDDGYGIGASSIVKMLCMVWAWADFLIRVLVVFGALFFLKCNFLTIGLECVGSYVIVGAELVIGFVFDGMYIYLRVKRNAMY